MSTINSNTLAYCTPVQMQKFYDWRTIADYCSDTDARPAQADLSNIATASGAILATILSSVSGDIEMGAFKGTRYSPDDLLKIACLTPYQMNTPTNATATLNKLTAQLAMFYVWERRPQRFAGVDMPLSCRAGFEMLDQLTAGTLIFGLLEVAQAAVPPPVWQTQQMIAQRNPATYQSRRYFGRRADENIPGNQCG